MNSHVFSSNYRGFTATMYVCPHCKGSLSNYSCDRCGTAFPICDGIPCFLTASADITGRQIGDIYDDIYSKHQDVWVDQGRSDSFLDYFSDLVGSLHCERILEIGCGEGMLLASLPGSERHGIDPSVQALVRARSRAPVNCAVARAEELPFPAASFDVLVSVGVMEHFEKPDIATAEIARVLVPSGYYVTLIQTDLSRLQRIKLKVREFLFPRFRPTALLRWVQKKLRHPIVQPLRRSYTPESARNCLETAGLVVKQTICKATHPTAPLAGPHVVIFVSQKPLQR